ncbi:MAG: helix-turn-helix transcriptional regulator [Solirubrobacteraceae bacterium]|jgi:transcriptional regulator with XRE-family HTH domain
MTKAQQNELGSYITKVREAKGLSLRALAEAAKVGMGSLSEIENGRRLARTETLRRIAEALGIDWEDLYALAGYGRPQNLPSFGPYLRSKYGDQLSAKDLKQLERYFKSVTEGKP